MAQYLVHFPYCWARGIMLKSHCRLAFVPFQFKYIVDFGRYMELTLYIYIPVCVILLYTYNICLLPWYKGVCMVILSKYKSYFVFYKGKAWKEQWRTSRSLFTIGKPVSIFMHAILYTAMYIMYYVMYVHTYIPHKYMNIYMCTCKYVH